MQDFQKWMIADWGSVIAPIVSMVGIYIAVTICLRILGLRSFSKMSSTDFVTTVALGSIMAAVITTPDPSLIIGTIAVTSVFVVKWLMAMLRRHTSFASRLLDNEPLCLMRGNTVLKDNLDRTDVSLEELHSKLREANVWSYDQVICVVLETTGDVSVLHRSKDEAAVNDALFADVREFRAA